MKSILANVIIVGCVCMMLGCAATTAVKSSLEVRDTVHDGFLDYQRKAEQGDAEAQHNLAGCYFMGQGVAKNQAEAMKWCRKAAEQGYAAAQDDLGQYYFTAQGVTNDYHEAVLWFRRAAEQGYGPAQYNLGQCYRDGTGVARDAKEAVKWIGRAAEQNNDYAQYMLGLCYRNGQGVTKDLVEAFAWFAAAAMTSPIAAQARSALAAQMSPSQVTAGTKRSQELRSQIDARFRSNGSDVPRVNARYIPPPSSVVAGRADELPNLAQAFPTEKLIISHREGAIEWYLYETEVDFKELKKELLQLLGQGWVESDDAEFTGVDKGSAAGFCSSRYPSIRISLHICWETGPNPKHHVAHILKSDSAKSGSRKITNNALLRALAESGNVKAQTQLGFAYFTGDAVQKDVGEAIKWWRKAAEQGDALGQFSLGVCYDLGNGVATDYKTAIALYEKAAGQELCDAEFALGVCYNEGKGVVPDLQQARQWYRKAAERNHSRAQFNLGTMYILGEGGEKDPIQAYAWYSLSQKAGGNARRQIAFLEETLPPEQISIGRNRAHDLAQRIEANLARTVQRKENGSKGEPASDDGALGVGSAASRLGAEQRTAPLPRAPPVGSSEAAR